MLKRLHDKIRSEIENVTRAEILETALLAVAVLMVLAFLGVFDRSDSMSRSRRGGAR
jgi:hypothetical protein